MARERLTAADRERIGRVFEAHRPFVEAVAVQHAGRDDAGDVVAEVGLRLCQSLDGLRDPAAVRAWMYRATVNAARDLYGQRRALQHTRERLAAVSPAEEPVEDPDERLEATRRHAAFVDALNRLKSRDRQLICNSLGLAGVSSSNGPTRHDGADRVALHRARRRLRDVLQTNRRLNAW